MPARQTHRQTDRLTDRQAPDGCYTVTIVGPKLSIVLRQLELGLDLQRKYVKMRIKPLKSTLNVVHGIENVLQTQFILKYPYVTRPA